MRLAALSANFGASSSSLGASTAFQLHTATGCTAGMWPLPRHPGSWPCGKGLNFSRKSWWNPVNLWDLTTVMGVSSNGGTPKSSIYRFYRWIFPYKYKPSSDQGVSPFLGTLIWLSGHGEENLREGHRPWQQTQQLVPEWSWNISTLSKYPLDTCNGLRR